MVCGCRLASVVLSVLAAACSNPAPRSTTAPVAREPCGGRGIVVRVTPPEPGGPVATLRGTFAGEGMGADAEWTCLIRGDGGRLVHGEFRTQVRAHATDLQRVDVARRPILVRIPPRGELRIHYHPCANWQLAADWLDDGTMDRERTVHALRSQPCPNGFIGGGDIHEADDARCGSAEGPCAFRRCVRAARLAFEGAPGTSLAFVDDVNPDGEPLQRLRAGASTAWAPYGGFCPQFTEIATGRERVRIAPGVGERWILRVDDQGTLGGTVTER